MIGLYRKDFVPNMISLGINELLVMCIVEL